ncbi:hypothetical protein J7L18_03315 [Candidatus Bathyarchaeota archaeon]|nr:hypothetical protein [Candidatus Bathyarchaeota archaeon]
MSEIDRKTTVTLHKSALRKLAELKVHPRQSYEEVILRLLEVYEEWKRSKR